MTAAEQAYPHSTVDYSFTVLFDEALQARRWERNPRQGELQPRFLCHRFAVRGGLTFGEVLAEHAMRANRLLQGWGITR